MGAGAWAGVGEAREEGPRRRRWDGGGHQEDEGLGADEEKGRGNPNPWLPIWLFWRENQTASRPLLAPDLDRFNPYS